MANWCFDYIEGDMRRMMDILPYELVVGWRRNRLEEVIVQGATGARGAKKSSAHEGINTHISRGYSLDSERGTTLTEVGWWL